MTREEILEAITDDKMMPFIQPWQLAQIVAFVIENYRPSLLSNLDEAAEEYSENILANNEDLQDAIEDAYKTGGMLVAGQFQKIEGDLVDWYSTSDGKDYCCGVKTIDAFEAPEGFYIRKK